MCVFQDISGHANFGTPVLPPNLRLSDLDRGGNTEGSLIFFHVVIKYMNHVQMQYIVTAELCLEMVHGKLVVKLIHAAGG